MEEAILRTAVSLFVVIQLGLAVTIGVALVFKFFKRRK